MAGITLAQAEAQLALWIAASAAVAANQSYSINGRAMTRAEARSIPQMIDYWERKVQQLSRGGRIQARLGTPVS